MGNEKLDMVLCGYIRKYIEPFAVMVPLDLINMCFAYLLIEIETSEWSNDDSD